MEGRRGVANIDVKRNRSFHNIECIRKVDIDIQK